MDSEGHIKSLVRKRMHRCIVCHHTFSDDDIDVISNDGNIWTMLVECPDCHTRSFVAAVLADGDSEEARLALRRLTDGDDHEAIRGHISRIRDQVPPAEARPDGPPVNAGDVVDMHEFLDAFDGDFRKLFTD